MRRSVRPWIVFALLCAAGLPARAQVPAAEAPPSDLDAQNTEVADLYMAGEYAEGVKLAHEYMEQWETRRGRDSMEWCSMFSNLGPLLHLEGELDEAAVVFPQAIDCTRRTLGPESEDLASVLNNYGSYLGSVADFGRAELALEESLRLLRLTLGDDHVYVAITLNNLAINRQNQGDDLAALPTMQEAVERLRASLGAEHPTTATAINNLGRLYVHLGELEKGEALLREALATREEQLGEEHRDTLIGRRDLGVLLSRRGENEEAATMLRRCVEGFRSLLGPDHPDLAMSHHEWGRVLARLERWDESRVELETALEIYRGKYEEGHSSHIQLQRELGELALARGDAEAAVEWMRGAVASFEAGRTRAGEGLERASYLDNPWSALAIAALEAGDEDEAWRAVENSRSRVLKELMPETQAPPFHPGEHEAMLGWLDLEFHGQSRHWVWVDRGEGVKWHRLPRATSSSAEALRRQLGEPGSLLPLRSSARELFDQRLAPAWADLRDVQHLVVAPGGDMLAVPVEALLAADGRWIGEHFAVSYAPSAGVLGALLATKPTDTHAALLVGDPPLGPYDEGLALGPPSDEVTRGAAHGDPEALAKLPPLPGTRDEVRALERFWTERTVLLGPEASESRLVQLAEADSLRRYAVLHFATHALVDQDDADASCLVLAQTGLPVALDQLSAGERLLDGLVSTREILEEWHLDADLVTLSACNSALGRRVDGEGHVGFAHAFLRAGARCTLVSLWGVPDRATSRLMTHFYEAWRERGQSKVEALTLAQRDLREYRDDSGRRPYEHPYYWAAFVLMGDHR